DWSHEAIAPPVLGLDDLLPSAVVSYRFTRGHDAAGEGGLAHHLAGPELFEQFIFGDHMVATVEKIGQDIKDFGLNANRPAAAAQLVEAVVQFTVVKTIEHRRGSEGNKFPDQSYNTSA